jgi:hypothetical protein
MADCTYLTRKNRAGVKSEKVECGGAAVAVYHSTEPDAFGNRTHPRCNRHDTEAAQRYVQTHDDWSREEL